MKEKLTQERLKELLSYDPETGIFIWKIKIKSVKKEDIAGCIDKKNYRVIRINGKNYFAHRLAFLFMEGYFPENDTDHIDRDKNNNKWNNLREVSHTCNMRNRNIMSNNKSGITGVLFDNNSKKWRAFIKIGNLIRLGSFNNIIDAVKARWEAEVKYNFPNCNISSSAYVYLKEHGGL